MTAFSSPPPEPPGNSLFASLARLHDAADLYYATSEHCRPLVAFSPSATVIASVRFELALSSSQTIKLY